MLNVFNLLCLKTSAAIPNFVVTKNVSIYRLITELSPDLDSVIASASFVRDRARFRPLITEEGLCYTFNALNSREMFTDKYISLFFSRCNSISYLR